MGISIIYVVVGLGLAAICIIFAFCCYWVVKQVKHGGIVDREQTDKTIGEEKK